jgi:hypothetical protein
VELDDPARNRKAQPRSVSAPLGRDLMEPVEHPSDVSVRDPLARVLDRDPKSLAGRIDAHVDAHVDATPRRGVPERVVQEIRERPLDLPDVGGQERELAWRGDVQRHARTVSAVGELGDDVVYELCDGDRLGPQRWRAAVEAGEVEQALGQASESVGVSPRRIEKPVRVLRPS